MSFTFLDYIKYYDTLSAFVLRSLGISAESDSLNTCGLEVTALAAFYVTKYNVTTILTNRSYQSSYYEKKELNSLQYYTVNFAIYSRLAFNLYAWTYH